MTDILTTYLFEDSEKLLNILRDESEKKIFEEKKESGDIKGEFALLMNPKHKDIIPELWFKTGLFIPIVWSQCVEEDKCYVVTDKTFVENAKANINSIFGLKGQNDYKTIDKLCANPGYILNKEELKKAMEESNNEIIQSM